MGVQDLLITPFYLIVLLAVAYALRPACTTAQTKRFFLPALAVRFFGAIMLGVIYQFHYGGGDTFNYFDHGSKYIWQGFMDDPLLGVNMLLDGGGQRQPETFQYTQHIWYYRDPASFMIVRIVAFIDIFTLHTYSATALFFAAFSFSGVWALYSAVQQKYPQHTKWLAYGVLFMPSVVFWGSGILKDTVTLGALGWMTWALIRWIDLGQKGWKEVTVLVLSFLLIYHIKIYIVICFVPMVGIWLLFKNLKRVRSMPLKILVAPFLIVLFAVGGFLALQQISADNAKYSLDNVAEQARITAYDIRYGWGAREEGDGGYDIGIPDGTVGGMVQLMPKAIVVSLFRPFPWEVRNPFMLLAALEALVVLFFTLKFLVRKGGIGRLLADPFLVFCFFFALLFAFAVGVSAFNFGTLLRYKIPLMPFYVIVLVVLQPLTVRRRSTILHENHH